ncbi:MAG TPA: efflux RND transporter permease subunit [Candidatus Udaeobacter sp.]|jgi:multidrug efflux pump subunit AcrB|nr:efflux RND transporter permease subunit [Candidatus Udaeobacter sp.]
MIHVFEGLRRSRRAVSAALVVFGIVGVILGARLPASILPEVTFPRLTVIAGGGERPGEEVLREITKPIEAALRRVPQLREIRSTTSRGDAEFDLDFEWGTNMDLALQRVQAQLEATRGQLPDGTNLEAKAMSPTLFPVLGLSLTSDSLSLAELRDLAILELRPDLATLPGVGDVVVQGGRRPEARITLDPAALESRGLDAATVATTVKNAGDLGSVGLLESNRELYLGLTDARPTDLATLEALPIPVKDGPPVPLAALGKISLEETPEFTRYVARGREAVLINVMRRPSASALAMGDAVKQWLTLHRHELPRDLQIETFYDQSDLVHASVISVRDGLLVGALFAIAVVALVLGSLGLGLLGAIVLPGSIALTLLGFALTGQSLNMMTLGGIAAAVGLVLDDAIVVVEHLAHRVAHAGDRFNMPEAMGEILPVLTGSSLCTIAIFIPFMFLGGVTGAFFRVLALAMALMLGSSWLLCVTLVPLIARLRAPRAPADEPRPSRIRRLRERASSQFDRLADYAARHAWVGLIPPLVLIALLVPLKMTLGTGFLPEMDEGSLILDFITPAGTSLDETGHMLAPIEREIARTPEIESWSRRTGDQLGFFITEPNTGDYVLRLRAKRSRSSDDVAEDLRHRIESVAPAVEIEFGQLVEDVIGDLTTNPEPIEVRLFSEDRKLIEQRARQASEIISGVRGVVDVKSGVVVSGPILSIVPSQGAVRLGLAPEDVTRATEPLMAGIDAGSIPRGARQWPVRVVLPRPAGGPDALSDARVPVAPGRWVRLGDVARLRVDPGETEIARDNQRTMVHVTGRLEGRDLGSAVAEIRGRLAHGLSLPADGRVEYAGLWAEQQSSFRGLLGVLAGAAAAVVMILVAAFRSWPRTLAVLLVVAASLAGVFVALHIGGATFNISSFVGAIMVVGIVAENCYFLVASHQDSLAEGLAPADAAAAAARRRARPVLMTTAAGVAALLPLSLGWGSGSALLRPLALAVVGGFLNAAPLILIVLPSLLARTGGGTTTQN